MQKIHYPSADFGHNTPHTQHATRNTQHATRNTQSWCIRLLVFMHIFIAGALQSLNAQPGTCQTNDVTALFPNMLGMCDFQFTVTFFISFDYDSSTPYTFVIEYDPNRMGYVDDGSLTNDTITQPTPTTERVTGTFTAPFNGDSTLPSFATLTLTFDRNGTWNGLDKVFFVNVFDSGCPSDPLVATFDAKINIIPDFFDMRTTPWSNISTLTTTLGLLPSASDACLVPESSHILIDDALIIDQTYCFTPVGGRKNLVLMPGARIVVNNGATLTLSNMDIFTCGGTLAQGIIVESGSTLIANGCTFNDSRFAIDAQPGSTISLVNNAFFDNYIGLNLDMSGATSGTNRVNILAFSGNSFSTAQQAINTPFQGMTEQVEARGYCGIRLINYRDFNVWGGNTFSQLANGIIGTNSTGNLGNMSFSDMNSEGSQVYSIDGFGIYLAGKTLTPQYFNINEFWTSMTFNTCRTGIFAYRHALNVENVTMTNVDVGIDVSGAQTKDIVIDGNTITARRYGIRSGLNEPLHPISAIRNNEITITALATGISPVTGIEMEEGAFGTVFSGWNVNNNEVTMQLGGHGISYRNGIAGALESNVVNNSGTGSTGPYKGIRVEGASFSKIDFNNVDQASSASNSGSQAIYSSGGWANGITCNCVDNTSVGLQFFDMADFTDNVRGNKLNNHDDTGLQLGNEEIGNAYIGTQYHTGNEWVVAPSGFGAINRGSTSDMVDLSKFWVDPNEKSGALSPSVDPEDWFEDDPTTAPSFECSTGCAAPTTPPPFEGENDDKPTSLDWAVLTDKLFPDVFEHETNWKGAYRLYRKVLRQPALATYSTDFEHFVDDNQHLSTGKLAYIAEEKSELFSLTTTENSVLESRRVTWRQKTEAVRQLDSLRQSGATVSSSQFNTAAQQSADAQTLYQQYIDSLLPARRAKIQTLLTLNAAVTTYVTPADNHKTVNEIVLNLLLSDTLVTGNLATLESIAGQCPLEGGDAVYEARAIVSYYTGADFDDYDLCASSQPRQQQAHGKPSDLTTDLSLYPNPTSGEVFLPVSGEVLVRVFDNTGQLQMEKMVSDNRLNLSQLQPGIYRLQLFRESQMLVTQSVILLNH